MLNRLNAPTVFLSGGLGNQLFQIAAVLQIEPKVLIINTSQTRSYFELEEFLQFLAKKRGMTITIDSTKPSLLFCKAHNYLLRSKQWRIRSKFHKLLINRSIQIVFIASGISYKEINLEEDLVKHKKVNPNSFRFNVIGYFQKERVAQNLRKDLNEYLDLSFGDALERQNSDFDSNITMHVRRGDYSSEEKIGMLSLSYFKSALTVILKTRSSSRLDFFTNGNVDPQEITCGADIKSLFEVDSTSALELLAKMRQGEIFLISNSTLSWWAAYLCENPKKQVFAPGPWFRKLSEPVNFIPNDWNRLPAIWSQGKNN
jgi:hypothetical protein